MRVYSANGNLSTSVLGNNIPTFYIIPKGHKSLKNPPGRPIVSKIKEPLEKTGRYLDSHLKEMVMSLKSYIKDTRDVLASEYFQSNS